MRRIMKRNKLFQALKIKEFNGKVKVAEIKEENKTTYEVELSDVSCKIFFDEERVVI